jgi:hypothetical protein
MVNGPEGPLVNWTLMEGIASIGGRVRRRYGGLRGRIFMAAQEENWPPFGACLSRVRRRAACTVCAVRRFVVSPTQSG